MKNSLIFLFGLIVLLAVVAAGGCAQDDAVSGRSVYRAEQEAGGSLPWNRPESWEAAGPLGAFINQGQ